MKAIYFNILQMKFMTFYDDCCKISSIQRLTNYPLLRKGSCCNAKKNGKSPHL